MIHPMRAADALPSRAMRWPAQAFELLWRGAAGRCRRSLLRSRWPRARSDRSAASRRGLSRFPARTRKPDALDEQLAFAAMQPLCRAFAPAAIGARIHSLAGLQGVRRRRRAGARASARHGDAGLRRAAAARERGAAPAASGVSSRARASRRRREALSEAARTLPGGGGGFGAANLFAPASIARGPRPRRQRRARFSAHIWFLLGLAPIDRSLQERGMRRRSRGCARRHRPASSTARSAERKPSSARSRFGLGSRIGRSSCGSPPAASARAAR